ncbi:glucose-induced degradation complex subunit GID8 NDAI_0H02880 [Naumovozyma dairenensis CBS 421]|uniref:CTLH domain-containing protein n=1 Tax=Naumovozyma dairenensis (strain ATCC 10597 / BCRC 20456 / CBS 421 / NBRC 0211 / NRRL Y-12639) TaxID=1071378 RepID=G0WFA1_NAUDC|nr:hypothetical protein NDAI_0H02880 [Naumovozyma dairenensis CBS 421]CCD26462.1 hypothetical protein NDAI_0H02880 [Naumovozyma dairenensis CBS 421]
MTAQQQYYKYKTFSKEEWNQLVSEQSSLNDFNISNSNKFYHLSSHPITSSSSISLLPNTSNSNTLVPPSTSTSNSSTNNTGTYSKNREISMSKLLLNYFISLAYEESSIRMAKELGFVKNNKDAIEFNQLYKITERHRIMKLIKLGQILKAINLITSVFGISILENSTEQQQEGNDGDDLHFNLLLLNLIEMIRSNHQSKKSAAAADDDDDANNDFILKLIQYSKENLAIKASTNKYHMEQLELVITLLLFPNDDESNEIFSKKLPRPLKNLYSLSLRSKIANLLNKKLLNCIHSNVSNQNKFPDLLNLKQFNEFGNAANSNTSNQNKILLDEDNDLITQSKNTRMKNSKKNSHRHHQHDHEDRNDEAEIEIEEEEKDDETKKENTDTVNSSISGNIIESNDFPRQSSLTSNKLSDFEINDNLNDSSSNYWNETKKILKQDDNNISKDIDRNKVGNQGASSLSYSLSYEPNLIQLIKLWAWCENQLHANDIGVPRVEN